MSPIKLNGVHFQSWKHSTMHKWYSGIFLFHCNLWSKTEREDLWDLISWMMSMGGGEVSNWKNMFCCTLSSTWTSGLFLASQALVSPDKPHQGTRLNPSPSFYLPLLTFPSQAMLCITGWWCRSGNKTSSLCHYSICWPHYQMLEYMEMRLFNTKMNELMLLYHFRWPL